MAEGTATTTHPDPTAATTTTPQKMRRSWRTWHLSIAVVVSLLIGGAIGAAGNGGEDDGDEIAALTAERDQIAAQRDRLVGNVDRIQDERSSLTERESELTQRETALAEREAAISAQEEAIKANTVTDGVWTVGVDIEPGTYRATGVGSDCYWQITRTGSNGDDIIENDIPGGGNPSVVLSEGQDFTSARCGEWVKQ